MPRIALVSFVPILRNFDRGQRNGRPKRGESQLFGEEDREISRYRRDAVGLRNGKRRDDKTGQAQQNIICRNLGLQGLLHDLMRGMAGVRCLDDNMACSAETGPVVQGTKLGMILAGNAQISIEKEALTSQPAWRLRKGADRQVGLAGLKLRLEVPGIERQRLQREPGSLLGHFAQKQGKKAGHPDIGHEELEYAVGGARIE